MYNIYIIKLKQPIYLRKYRLLQTYATCRYIMLAKQNKPFTCGFVKYPYLPAEMRKEKLEQAIYLRFYRKWN